MESEQQPCLCCELGLSNGHGGPRGGALKCVGVDGWVEEFADDMMMRWYCLLKELLNGPMLVLSLHSSACYLSLSICYDYLINPT